MNVIESVKRPVENVEQLFEIVALRVIGVFFTVEPVFSRPLLSCHADKLIEVVVNHILELFPRECVVSDD